MLPALFVPVRELARSPRWRVCAALFAVAAIALGFLPLLSTIGLEWSLAFTVPAALFAGYCGIHLSRRGQNLEPLALWAAAFPVTLGPLVPPLLIGYLHGLHVRNCTPGQSALFWLLGPVGAALVASATGILFGRVLRRPRHAPALFTLVVVVSLVRTGVGILAGPTQFTANQFLGWIPGPIYDQAAGIAPGFWYLRLLGVLLSFLLLLAAGFFRERLPGARARAAALALVAIANLVALSFRHEFKLDIGRDDIRERALSGVLHTKHFDIYYSPNGVDAKKLDLIASDHEFRLAQVSAFLGVTPSKRITSWYYPSESEKKKWTGAGGTQVANPWKREIYVNDEGWPHPVLQHELTHVVSAEFGNPLFFRISMHHLFLPNIGFIEGIAVASAWHDDGNGTPHEQSAAMMRSGLLPDPEDFLGLKFWGGRSAVSYTAAGSFIRYLADTYGIDKVRDAYAWSNFQKSFGKSVPQLADEWRSYLTTLPVPPKRAAAARETFSRPSIFERPCARELALLHESGDRLLGEGRIDDAIKTYEKWRAVDDRSDPLWNLVNAYRRKQDLRSATRLMNAIVEREVPDSPGFWNARMVQADLAWQDGRAADARDLYAEIFSAHVSSDIDRQVWMRRAGAAEAMKGSTPLAFALRDWLVPTSPSSHQTYLAALSAATALAQQNGAPSFAASYLLGRYLLYTGDPAAALPALELCADLIAKGEVNDSAAIRAEVFAMLGDAHTRTGHFAEAAAAWDEMRSVPGAASDVRDRATDGAARTAWNAAHDPHGEPR